jgi:hypothetical protein
MTFRLRRIETTADGRRIARDRDVAGDQVSIGRAADNDLHLPDLSLDPRHATIMRDADGRLTVSAAGTPGFLLDGRKAVEAGIDPATGAEMRFGTWRVTAGLDGDGAVLLCAERTSDEDAHDLAEAKAFSLQGLLPGKRRLAWILALGIMVLFLIVPIAGNLLRGPAPPAGSAVTADHIPLDVAWSTGALSRAHRALGDRCEACHVRPFESVRDSTCISCHKDVADHAPADRLGVARGAGELGEQFLRQVAHQFGKEGPGACTDCHTEHEGAQRMAAPSQKFCADCHGALNARLQDTKLGNAGDFGKSHPRFRPAIALTAGSSRLSRVSLDRPPHEASGLSFPHQLHLDPSGGAARMAARIGDERGYGANGLACKDCHRPTADGVRFAPIDMERDCETCHSLAYDRVGATFRRLRHGDVDQMVADLSVAPVSSRALVSGRLRPGEYGNRGTYSARFTPAAGGIGLPQVALSRDGICGECHLPAAQGSRLSVLPVTQVNRYMHHGWFSHRAHRQEKCTTCHAADRSRTSADLLLPDIATCRTCHLGEDAKGNKVPSACAMCHSYHLTAQAPRGAAPVRKD